MMFFGKKALFLTFHTTVGCGKVEKQWAGGLQDRCSTLGPVQGGAPRGLQASKAGTGRAATGTPALARVWQQSVLGDRPQASGLGICPASRFTHTTAPPSIALQLASICSLLTFHAPVGFSITTEAR